MSQMVQVSSRPNDIVLDLFMGSGTTLRAAKDLGRRAIGIDDQEWCCEIAAKRCAQESLFAPANDPANDPEQQEMGLAAEVEHG